MASRCRPVGERKKPQMSGDSRQAASRPASQAARNQGTSRPSGDKTEAQAAALRQAAAWMKEQTGHVWRALAGKGRLEPAAQDLRVTRSGKTSLYGFWYQGTCLAQGKSYFSQEEEQWRFELTWVAPEYYPQVKDYYTRRMKG